MPIADMILTISGISVPSHLRQGGDIGCPKDEQNSQGKHLRVREKRYSWDYQTQL